MQRHKVESEGCEGKNRPNTVLHCVSSRWCLPFEKILINQHDQAVHPYGRDAIRLKGRKYRGKTFRAVLITDDVAIDLSSLILSSKPEAEQIVTEAAEKVTEPVEIVKEDSKSTTLKKRDA
jgi:hypothetical protein